MHTRHSSRFGIFLASLVLLCGGALSSVANAAPTVTIAGLRVNGVNAACGATVSAGDTVCVRFSSDQTANVQVTVTKGTTTTAVASGTATGGVNYITCVTAGIADGVTRTYTVKATNINGTGSATCTYIVGSTTAVAPSVTIAGLLVNETAKACGATVGTGDEVCVQYQSDQNANVTITVQKGSGTPQTVSSGTVVANTLTTSCVTAGISDGLTRTLTVTVSNANGTDSATCTYIVGSTTAMAPTVTIAGLRVNGVNKPCGSTVAGGNTVCVRFSSDQTANVKVTVKKGLTETPVASGTASAGVNYITCVTAGADSGTRTFTVTATNANGTGSATCVYIVP